MRTAIRLATDAGADLLPQDLDAERAVLAGITIDNDQLDVADQIVRGEDFFRESHRTIFRAMQRLRSRGEAIDLITLRAELDREGKLAAIGGEIKGLPLTGAAYISALLDGFGRSTNVRHYARIVKDKQVRRDTIVECDRLEQSARNGSTLQEFEAARTRAAELLTAPSGAEPPAPLAAIDLAAAISANHEAPPWMIHSWIARGDVVCLAAEPKMMKSWLALDLAIALASAGRFLPIQVAGGPYRVLYLDEENNPRIIGRRLRKLARGLGMSAEAAATLPIKYLSGNHLNLDDAERRATFFREIEAFRPDLVILDSLIRFHRRDENSNPEMSAFAAEVLKPISADHGAAVLALHHLGKPGPSRAASDLGHRVRGASDILAFVDSLWTLDRDSEGTTTLRNAIGRWDETAEPLKVMMEDLEDGEAIRLVGEPVETTARDAVRDALLVAERVGVLRQEIVADLKQTDPKNADRQATRLLGKLHGAGRARRRKEGNGTRYWLATFAPEDAV